MAYTSQGRMSHSDVRATREEMGEETHSVTTEPDDQGNPASTWSLTCSCGYESLEHEDEDAANSAADEHVSDPDA